MPINIIIFKKYTLRAGLVNVPLRFMAKPDYFYERIFSTSTSMIFAPKSF